MWATGRVKRRRTGSSMHEPGKKSHRKVIASKQHELRLRRVPTKSSADAAYSCTRTVLQQHGKTLWPLHRVRDGHAHLLLEGLPQTVGFGCAAAGPVRRSPSAGRRDGHAALPQIHHRPRVGLRRALSAQKRWNACLLGKHQFQRVLCHMPQGMGFTLTMLTRQTACCDLCCSCAVHLRPCLSSRLVLTCLRWQTMARPTTRSIFKRCWRSRRFTTCVCPPVELASTRPC